MFMDLLDVDYLDAPALGEAIESVSDIEIVLVLDVSGSMVQNSSTKLANLRIAAAEFVQTVLQDDTDNRISIAIVPFNGQVNLGATLRARFNVTDLHGVTDVDCVDLPAAAYATLASLTTSLSMPLTAHADTFTTTTRQNAYYTTNNMAPDAANRWCPPRPGNIVRLPSHSISTLQSNINGLTGIGATSINAGMRWGMTLLDPGSRTLFTNLIAAGQIPAIYAGRPYDYDRENTLKIMVLMTDGSHFPEERVNAGYRSGNSPIWLATTATQYSIYHDIRVDRTNATTLRDSRPFWVPHLAQWHARPWNGTNPPPNGGVAMPYAEGLNRRFDTNNDGTCTNADDGRGALTTTQACWSGATQQTWPQVWAATRMHWVAWQLYARALGGTTSTTRLAYHDAQMNLFRTLTPVTDMDAQLANLCGLAQDEGVVIFGIAFEAPTAGQAAISSCASSPAHYFNAQGLQIQTAFRAIAAQINMLRLIQ
jgi:hypothetical protein